jgi:Phosphotransferase enzyme family
MIEDEVEVLEIDALPQQRGDRFAARTGFDPRAIPVERCLHLPVEAIVVRLSSDTPTNEARAARIVSLTSWIADHGGPALVPTPHPQPVREAGTVATLWPYLPSPSIPRARDLAEAVRELHCLDAQPPTPPEHHPLARLREALDLDIARDQPVLSTDTREWLLARAARLQHAYDTTPTPLGRGLIHADVQPDNLLQDRDGRWLLIDGDRASHGPVNSTSPSPSLTTSTIPTSSGLNSASPTDTTSLPGPAGR